MLRKFLAIPILFTLVLGGASTSAAIRAAPVESLYLPVVHSAYCPPLYFDHFEGSHTAWPVVDDPTRTMETLGGFVEYDHPIVDHTLRDLLAADLSGDGLNDLITASDQHPGLNYWENLGGGYFEEHRQVAVQRFVDQLHAVDLDLDSDIDLITGGLPLWWENTGGPDLVAHVIDLDTGPGTNETVSANLDGDGDIDILSATKSLGVVWWESDGTPADGGWIRRAISSAFVDPENVAAVDFDADGDLDVLSVSYQGRDVAWWENDGTPGDGGWVFHPILTDQDGFYTVIAADVDQDGDPDVVGAGYQPVVWWENDGLRLGDWPVHPVTASFYFGYDLDAGDFDRDGDVDILAVNIGPEPRYAVWFENDGAQNFTWRTLSDAVSDSYAIRAGDIDGDQLVDVLGVDASPNQVIFWINRSKEYRIHIKPAGAVSAAAAPFQAADFSASVRVRNQYFRAGSYGLVFGLAGDWEQFYSFEVDPGRNYFIWKYDYTSGWTLLRQGATFALNAGGGENLLKVERFGAAIRVYANGQLLDSVDDAAFSGLRGLGLIATSTTQANLDVRYDQFEVRASGCQ